MQLNICLTHFVIALPIIVSKIITVNNLCIYMYLDKSQIEIRHFL